MRKKFISLLSIFVLCAAPVLSFTGCGSDAEATDTLVVLNYGKYIEADVLKPQYRPRRAHPERYPDPALFFRR